MLYSIRTLLLILIYLSKNSTFEINQGILFDNVKTGNYYQTSDHIYNKIMQYQHEENAFASIFISLDSKSSHLEISTNSILDILGTIGGSYELIHYVILTLFASLRSKLYYHTIINRVNSYQSSQNEPDVKMNKNRVGKPRNITQQDRMSQRSRKFDEQDDSKHQTITNHQFSKQNMLSTTVFQKFITNFNTRKSIQK